MKIAALTVTHDRPEFIPWLLWVFDSQSHDDKHLIIVDSSEEPLDIDRDDVTVFHTKNNNVAHKRNVALSLAGESNADAVAWFDDDDWSHPARLSILASRLNDDGKLSWAGSQWGWFVDVQTRATKRFCNRTQPTFNSSLYRYESVEGVLFDESIERGSDIDWMERISDKPWAGGYDPLIFWLCHDRNMGNRAAAHHFNRGFDDIIDIVGIRELTRTRSQLTALRNRLY